MVRIQSGSSGHGDRIRTVRSARGGSAAMPAQQLLEKLLQKQQPAANAKNIQIGSSPLILFQHSQSARLRDTAASSANMSATTHLPSNNPKRVEQQQQQAQAHAALYRRAQLRTPAENAARCLWGGSLWIEFLVREMTIQAQASINSLVWIRTTPRPVPTWLPSSDSVLDATQSYSNFWELGGGNDKEHDNHPLDDILSQIQSVVQDHNSPTRLGVVFESIAPWIQLYGWPRTRSCLQQLLLNTAGKLLVLLPVVTETMPSPSLIELEDWAHTLLWLSDHTGQGELHVLRKGIREQESTVREIWDFRLDTTTANGEAMLVVGDTHGVAPTDEESEADLVQEPTTAVTSQTPSSNKIVLKMEEEGRESSNVAVVNSTPTQPAPSGNAPRIFLQDDDPEFDDYDEEDPDDDLDI